MCGEAAPAGPSAALERALPILYVFWQVDDDWPGTPGAGDFDYLNDNETAETQFDYTTDNGITATLTVTVTGIGSPGDGDAGIF